MFRTHYDNLQVSRNASDSVIRAAYKSLIQKHHPDKNPESREEAERITKIVIEAFEVLSDPKRRKEHDAWIAAMEAENHLSNLKNSPKRTPKNETIKDNNYSAEPAKTEQSKQPSNNWIIYVAAFAVVLLVLVNFGAKREEQTASSKIADASTLAMPADFSELIGNSEKNADYDAQIDCLTEAVKVDAIEKILNTSSKEELDNFMLLVKRYKSRCETLIDGGVPENVWNEVKRRSDDIVKTAQSEWLRKSLSLRSAESEKN